MNRTAVGLVLLAWAGPLAAQESERHGAHEAQLGTVTFPNSGTPAAQPAFIRGVALLHSFEYSDAADAFRSAEQSDPGFALAYWMEALTHSHLLWGEDDADAARQVLGRLAPTPAARLARAPTPRERAYGAAIEAFYADTDVGTRARDFADSLRHLAARDPADLEAAAFACIAIQMSLAAAPHPAGADTLLRNEAIALGERVFAANPRHPGAAHYLIHAYDDPAIAQRGLPFALAYARIAPDAEHALHMPSHIFVQVGRWDDLIRSNELAWAASRAWVRRHGASGADLDFHSLEWLQYGYLEAGRMAEARALVDTARAVLGQADLRREVDARFVVNDLLFGFALASGDWSITRELVPPPLAPSTASRRLQSFTHFAREQAAYAAVMRGDTMPAARVAREYRALADSLPGGAAAHPFLTLIVMQLDGAVALRRGDAAAAIALLQQAARIEAAGSPAGPPFMVPATEQLGAALLVAHRSSESADAYRAALKLRPGRREALDGLARATARRP